MGRYLVNRMVNTSKNENKNYKESGYKTLKVPSLKRTLRNSKKYPMKRIDSNSKKYYQNKNYHNVYRINMKVRG